MSRRSPDAPVFVLYSHDGFGLGHVKRNLSIARAILRAAPRASAVLLSGVIPPTVGATPGIDVIKLPSIRKTGPGQWRPESLNIDAPSVGRVRRRLIEEVLVSLSPDVVLVDYLPVGVWGELIPVFERLGRSRDRPRFALGLRDMLDSRESVSDQWARSGSVEAIASVYDRILIYGAEEVFATASYYGLLGRGFPPVRYCGYLSNDDPVRGREEIRHSLGVSTGQRLVVVTGGGGRDAYEIMRCSIDAIGAAPDRDSIRGVLLVGAFMDRARFDALRRHADRTNVTVVPYTADAVGFIAAADAVISMGGYNTLCEALRHGRKVVVVPRSGPSREQRMRAELFAAHGMVRTVAPERLEPARLGSVLADALSAPGPSPAIRIDAGEEAARQLLELASCRAPSPARGTGERSVIEARERRTAAKDATRSPM